MARTINCGWRFLMTATLPLICVIFLEPVCGNSLYSEGHQERLVSDLLREYSRYVRPVLNETKVLEVFYHMKLSRILKIDERNQILTTAFWLEQRWRDDFLVWDPLDYDNITAINIPTRQIWIPDTVLYDSADVDKEPGTGIMMTNAVVSSEGGVFWAAPAIFKSSCSLDITYFPFDKQTCPMKFGPWAYKGNEVVMRTVAEKGDWSQMTTNGQWELLDMPVVAHLVEYGCCPDPFSDVTFTLKLRRKALFYVFSLLFPSIFMSLISFLSFYLPAESGEKIGLNITVLLSLVFFLLLGAQLLPPTSDTVSLLGQLLATIIVVMSLETAGSVVILRLHHHIPSRPPPRWARKLILDRLAYFLRIKGRRHAFHDYTSADGEELEGEKATAPHRCDDLFEYDQQNSLLNSQALGVSLLQQLQLEPGSYGAKDTGGPGGFMAEGAAEYGTDATEVSLGATVQRIGRYIDKLVNRCKRKEKISLVQQQWIDMCVILDRLLMLLFALAIVMTSLIIILKMTLNYD
ncbi:neuronal acetylcholine receptor subunit alpha-10-like isoform X2 [Acanthaster planci]|uniref:Neuronal acetylcholine receptor subunit alpha-10-like isoform X2 n=1 Tax=Acanthaster planci TaxID=133434 RepID=A0A8B7YVG5_ACAPL|nr:neuronal acetylcholine receptor subunit alpha-10-like isoform X2 [Acanthaster planci]